MTRNHSKLIYLAAIFLLWHAMLFYGLPVPAIFAGWFLLSIWLYFAGPIAALMTASSVALFTLLLNVVLHWGGIEQSIYYRPHELMTTNQAEFGETFRPNTIFSMAAQFGDIEALEKAGVRESPHEITYRTDHLGFRNPADYADGQIVLLGDSFVAGASDTQSCILTEWLRRDHGIDAYNLGFPGDMDDYVRRFEVFRSRYGDRFKLALFVFEGNDFRPFSHKAAPATPGFLLGYADFFRRTSLWRYTRWLYLRIASSKDKAQHRPLVARVGDADMAFLSSDVGQAENLSDLEEHQYHFVEALRAMQPNLVQVFFIPIKYRVYAQWLNQKALPNAQFAYLSRAGKQAGIPIFDLTPSLVSEAERLLPKGEYVYWRDDTHWNCNGMRVAAAQVAEQLRAR